MCFVSPTSSTLEDTYSLVVFNDIISLHNDAVNYNLRKSHFYLYFRMCCLIYSTNHTSQPLNIWYPVWYFLPTWTLCTINFLHSYDLSITMILYIIVCLFIDYKQMWNLKCTIYFPALFETYFCIHLARKCGNNWTIGRTQLRK